MRVDLIDVRCLWALSQVQNRATKEEKSIPDAFMNERRIKQFSNESKQKSRQGHIVEKQNPLEHSHEDVEMWLTSKKNSQMSE